VVSRVTPGRLPVVLGWVSSAADESGLTRNRPEPPAVEHLIRHGWRRSRVSTSSTRPRCSVLLTDDSLRVTGVQQSAGAHLACRNGDRRRPRRGRHRAWFTERRWIEDLAIRRRVRSECDRRGLCSRHYRGDPQRFGRSAGSVRVAVPRSAAAGAQYCDRRATAS